MQYVNYTTEGDLLFAALSTGSHRHTTVDDLLFPKAGPRSRRERFLPVISSLRQSGLYNVL